VVTPYEIRSGGRAVSVRKAPSALRALIDYLRALGCRDEDMVRLGTGSVAWRGSVYQAVALSEPAAD
jgi:hypothetical protein